jgi:hypothetical protein
MEDETTIPPITTAQAVGLAVVTGAAIIGATTIAVLGYEWTKEGVRAFKAAMKKTDED